jgi:hypothetical protein
MFVVLRRVASSDWNIGFEVLRTKFQLNCNIRVKTDISHKSRPAKPFIHTEPMTWYRLQLGVEVFSAAR